MSRTSTMVEASIAGRRAGKVPPRPTAVELSCGVDAFKRLMRRVTDISMSAPSAPDGVDSTDFRAIVTAIEQSLAQGLDPGHPGAREGFLRAVADLLTCVALGGLPSDLETWDPITQTDYAYRPH